MYPEQECGDAVDSYIDIINPAADDATYMYTLKSEAGETIYMNSSSLPTVMVEFMGSGMYMLIVEGISNPCYSEIPIDFTTIASGVEASPDSFDLYCDTDSTLDVLANDLSTANSLTVISQPASGELLVQSQGMEGQYLQYISGGNQTGVFEFTYEICDPSGCCAQVVSSISISPCIDDTASGILYDYHQTSNCDFESGKVDVEIFSQTPGQTVFFKLFKPDSTIYAQNSTTNYPVLFKQVPPGPYMLSLSAGEIEEQIDIELGCGEEEDEGPIAPVEGEMCVFESYEESDCNDGLSTLEIFVNLPEGPAFHKLYDSAGNEVRINSTTANPCVFKNLPGGMYELRIYYGECVDLIPIELTCE